MMSNKVSDRISGYGMPVLFGLIGFGNVAAASGAANVPAQETPTAVAIITGYGMLAVAIFTAWSTHHARASNVANRRREVRERETTETRFRALEARIALLKAGYRCEHEECPIVRIATTDDVFQSFPKNLRPQPNQGEPPEDDHEEDNATDAR